MLLLRRVPLPPPPAAAGDDEDDEEQRRATGRRDGDLRRRCRAVSMATAAVRCRQASRGVRRRGVVIGGHGADWPVWNWIGACLRLHATEGDGSS